MLITTDHIDWQENEDLRKEIARLRDESRSESSSEESVKDEFANTTCQSGKCKVCSVYYCSQRDVETKSQLRMQSRDEANAFRIELIEAMERLKARELAVREAVSVVNIASDFDYDPDYINILVGAGSRI